jgi:hypothetical protein
VSSQVINKLIKEGIKEGFMELRSLTLKVWREKILSLDVPRKYL